MKTQGEYEAAKVEFSKKPSAGAYWRMKKAQATYHKILRATPVGAGQPWFCCSEVVGANEPECQFCGKAAR